MLEDYSDQRREGLVWVRYILGLAIFSWHMGMLAMFQLREPKLDLRSRWRLRFSLYKLRLKYWAVKLKRAWWRAQIRYHMIFLRAVCELSVGMSVRTDFGTEKLLLDIAELLRAQGIAVDLTPRMPADVDYSKYRVWLHGKLCIQISPARGMYYWQVTYWYKSDSRSLAGKPHNHAVSLQESLASEQVVHHAVIDLLKTIRQI